MKKCFVALLTVLVLSGCTRDGANADALKDFSKLCKGTLYGEITIGNWGNKLTLRCSELENPKGI